MKTIALVLLLPFLACETEPEPVTISKLDGHLIIRNNSVAPVYYAAFDSEILTRIEWVPFCGQDNMIQPTKAAAMSLTDFPLTTTNDITVFWWSECVQDSGSGIPRGQDLKRVIVKN